MSNIGYERKPDETVEDRMALTMSRLEPTTKERYEKWLRGYLTKHSLSETITIDQPFPVGNKETGGFFVATDLLYIQFDCSIKIYVIIPAEIYPTIKRDQCSVLFHEDGYGITGDELPPVFNDLNL